MQNKEQIKNKESVRKEFQNLLDLDFQNRELKENEIIKATITETSILLWIASYLKE